MPDNWQFSEEDLEQSLKDLGARMEYPPTREARRTSRWPPFLAPRWTAVTAALVLVAVVALSPAMRATLSGLFVSKETGLEAGGSAVKPEAGGTEDRYKQQPGVASQEDAGAPEAGGREAAKGCPSPSVEVVPARVAVGAKFRLRGRGFASGCDGMTPAREVEISFRQDGRTWKLATLDAESNLAFDAGLRVPENAAPGRATLLAITGSGERAKGRLVILR